MSKKLGDISETCPILKNIEESVEEIKDILGDSVTGLISHELDFIISGATEIRDTAAQLRDTASDIASSKDVEIEDVEKELGSANILIEELNNEIEELGNKIYELEANK